MREYETKLVLCNPNAEDEEVELNLKFRFTDYNFVRIWDIGEDLTSDSFDLTYDLRVFMYDPVRPSDWIRKWAKNRWDGKRKQWKVKYINSRQTAYLEQPLIKKGRKA